MKKKIMALILAVAMLMCAVPNVFAYSVRDAYSDFAANYPGFIDSIVAQGVSESVILDFLRALQNNLYMVNRVIKITDDNFEDVLIDTVMTVSNAREFDELQKAMWRAFPDAAYEAQVHGRIHADFMPLYEAVRSMVFDYDMLSSMDTGENDRTEIFIVNIGSVNDVQVEQGKTYKLDGEVEAQTETGVNMSLDIEWTNLPSTDKVGEFTAEGTVIIPEGYELEAGLSTDITTQVTVVEPDEDNNNDDNPGKDNDRNPDRNPGPNNRPDDNDYNNGSEDEEPVEHIYSFSDVDEKTELGRAVYALSDIGIINGYVDGTFKADNKIRRDEFAKIIVTAMEMLDVTAAANFTDVPADQWAYTFIASAQKAGLINGVGDGSFAPERNIRRDEVMTIIYRALENKRAFKERSINIPNFSDDSKVAGFARIPIYMLAQNGIVSGTKSVVNGVTVNNINPLSDATRGECVIMIYNALKMMGKVK